MIRSPAGFGGEDRIKRYLDYYQPSYGVMMLSAGQAFSPASLFAAGEQGVWYDPSDFSTMFQDSAGTTPVTAVEQPVGRILDKSGRGNTATQATSASRPVLSARVNLLTKTEQFDNAAWTKGALTISANTTATTDPLGGNAADKFQETATTAEHYVVQGPSVAAAQHTFSVYLKAAERTWATLQFSTGPISATWFNLAADGSGVPGTVASGFTAASTYVGNGWYLCSITGTSTATTWYAVINPSLGNGISPVYAGTLNSGIYVWGADLRVTNDGVGIPAYQRVNTSTDYDTTGFPYYLFFDGTDDSMVTATFTPGTDKAQVFAGVRKLSDASAILAETSTDTFGFNGTLAVNSSQGGTANYSFYGKGTAFAGIRATVLAAPVSNVFSVAYNIAQPTETTEILPRIDGIVPVTSPAAGTSGALGTGNFLAYPLYIGRRGGAAQPFNGRIYSLILRFGANLDATEISNTETWVNGKTMAY